MIVRRRGVLLYVDTCVFADDGMRTRRIRDNTNIGNSYEPKRDVICIVY